MSVKSRCLFWGMPVFALLLTGTIFAGEELPESNQKVSVGGYSFWQFGQIVKGYDRQQGNISHQWQNNVLIGLTIKAQPNERLNLVLNPEFYLNYAFPQKQGMPDAVHPFGIAYINEACGKYSFGDAENPFMQASLGMFVFKYNHEARNLGDYLFRTGTYPTFIISNFDFPAARLLGLHLSSDAIANLHADLLLTSEAFLFPLFDFSVTGIASYKLFNAIEIGAGVDFARVLPVMDSLTSPHWRAGNGGYYNSYITQDDDTAFYSFKATKVMARTTIDPKPFFGSPELFGPEDLKLYGEICWVGVEGYNAKEVFDSVNNNSYHAWYNNLNQRTPRMVGFNFPAFRILDVLSGELEYFPSVIPNDWYSVEYNQSPMPYLPDGYGSYKESSYNKGFWRWSVYAKKMIVQGFSVTGEAAFDHMRTTIVNGSTQFYETMTKAGHWHWKAKFGYSF
jgi:hypothetical protein